LNSPVDDDDDDDEDEDSVTPVDVAFSEIPVDELLLLEVTPVRLQPVMRPLTVKMSY